MGATDNCTSDNDSETKDISVREEKHFNLEHGMSIKQLFKNEVEIYKGLFDDIKKRYNLDTSEDIMMLDRALFNYILANRGSEYLLSRGMLITDMMGDGEITKLNPVIQGISHADKRFMEFMDKLKLSRYKRETGEMSTDERRDMKIMLSRLKKISEVREDVVGTSSYQVVECTPEEDDRTEKL